MPSGTGHLQRPQQDKPDYPLECDDSYYRIKLHHAQAFFPAGFGQQAKELLVHSSVESSFLPGKPLQSLYKLTAIKGNVPYHIGVLKNLTTLLPARATDTISITLKYSIIQASPFKSLADKMEDMELEAVVSLVKPEIAAAVTVSRIASKLLSFFLQEGKEHDLITLTMDLNLAQLQAGYYAVVGSNSNESYPNKLEIKNGYLTELGGRELTRHSYAVLQVQTIKRRGPESVRDEPWGRLLEHAEAEALTADSSDEDARADALYKWRTQLAQVRFLAQHDQSFLKCEIDAVIAQAHEKVEQKLLKRTVDESLGLEPYDSKWREVLGFSTPEDLRLAVRDYQNATAFSQHLLRQYSIN